MIVQNQTWIMVQSRYHLFSINTDGTIKHSVHHLGQPVQYETVSAKEPIVQYCVVPKDGLFHTVAKTANTIYYLKFPDNRDKHSNMLFRMGSNHNASHPYLFFYNSSMYICYLQTKDKECMLILKSYTAGTWEERTLIIEDKGQIHLEDTAFGVGNNGQLYVLLRYSNSHRENILSYLQYDLENESHQKHHLFLVKNPECRWTMGLGIDDQGKAHFSWTIYNRTTVTYHYANLYHANTSFMPLFFNCNVEPMIPYFIFMKEFVILLFWNGKQLIRFFYSLNRGQNWSKDYDIHFQSHTPIYMLQGVLTDPNHFSAPVRMLGIGLPFFRPLELIDFFNPFIWIKSSLPSMEMLNWVNQQLEQLRGYLVLQTKQLHQEVSGLSMENDELQRTILHLVDEHEHWETKEKKAVLTLNRLKTK